MMLVRLSASGSAVGNNAEWSPALRRVPTGVSLNIGSSLLCKTGQSIGRGFSHIKLLDNRTILLMLLQQMPSPLLHRSGLLSTGLISSLFSVPSDYLTELFLYPPQSLPFFLLPLSLFSFDSQIYFSFFFSFTINCGSLLNPASK